MDSYGILSLLPPLLAVIIAIRTKNVITALFWSGLLGVLFWQEETRSPLFLCILKIIFLCRLPTGTIPAFS